MPLVSINVVFMFFSATVYVVHFVMMIVLFVKSTRDESAGHTVEDSRFYIFTELSAAAFNAESAMSAPMTVDDDVEASVH